MCGIVGVFSNSDDQSASLTAYYALNLLQHRGQDAAGIAASSGDSIVMHHGQGLAQKVFQNSALEKLSPYKLAIGHVRYPTSIFKNQEDTQPFYVNQPYGIAMAHNGNLINAGDLREFLQENRRHVNTHSDSELLINLLAYEIDLDRHSLSEEVIFQAVERLHQKIKGSYSVIAMIPGLGLVAFRDPYGLRPLIYGVKESISGNHQHMLASESAALTSLGYEVVGDLHPGECLVVTMDGKIYRKQCALSNFSHTVCVFEYVYFARPDSVIDQISVYKARLRMGEYLAEKIKNQWPDKQIDSVIPVPETSRSAAIAVSQSLGVPFREGFVKNHYIGRTFIASEQKTRQAMVRRKLNILPLEFKGKNVLIIDDSIVRGTTSREIVRMAYEAGANRVYLGSASPPVRYPNIYGIDIPTHQELIAYQCDVNQVRKILGADDLIYQSVEDLIKAVSLPNSMSDIKFDLSCFNGQYVTGYEKKYIQKLCESRQNQMTQDVQKTLLI